jgi:hypothetical protein
MKRKPRLVKPTHRLEHDGTVYALVRVRYDSVTVKMLQSGEVVRSQSQSLADDIIHRKWRPCMHYMFGSDQDHIPDDARMVAL